MACTTCALFGKRGACLAIGDQRTVVDADFLEHNASRVARGRFISAQEAR